MRFLVQRVSEARVEVDGAVTGRIGRGFMVLVGICAEDSEAEADKLIRKLVRLRIFEDSEGRTNLDIDAVGGNLLMVSQFTLYADCRKGNRPSFVRAGDPEHARRLYRYICDSLRARFPDLQEGIFAAEMKVHLINDGPFTVLLDSAEI